MKHYITIMGDNTYNTLKNPPLKKRLNVVFTLKNIAEEVPEVLWVSGDPTEVIKSLERDGYESAVLIGGSCINTLFLENNLVSEIWLTIEPKIFGEGLSLFNKKIMRDINLKLYKFNPLNEHSILLKYRVSY